MGLFYYAILARYLSLSHSFVFFFRKISLSTSFGPKLAFVGVTMSPSVEKILSDATEDPCVERRSRARAENFFLKFAGTSLKEAVEDAMMSDSSANIIYEQRFLVSINKTSQGCL